MDNKFKDLPLRNGVGIVVLNKENKNNPAGAYKTPVSNETGQPIRR